MRLEKPSKRWILIKAYKFRRVLLIKFVSLQELIWWGVALLKWLTLHFELQHDILEVRDAILKLSGLALVAALVSFGHIPDDQASLHRLVLSLSPHGDFWATFRSHDVTLDVPSDSWLGVPRNQTWESELRGVLFYRLNPRCRWKRYWLWKRVHLIF